jgi:hypothetical protein
MMIEKGIAQDIEGLHNNDAKKWFQKLVQKDQYVGELYSINYETAKIQIHDTERQKVGGIPSLSFLIATRVDPDAENIYFKAEDTAFILLRVMDAAQLPNSAEAERIRVETAQRVSGETDKHWDGEGIMDTKTRVYLGYAGVECRIIGTFYLEAPPEDKNSSGHLFLKFGSDISNYYPNRGLKVYKPNSTALEEIVNYTDPSNLQEHIENYGTAEKVKLGYIRYASTNRKYQQVDDVPIFIYPADLLSQKSALFGMTRTGKSNTTKIIAKAVYELRYPSLTTDKSLRIGQIIFDPNGEYANENVQDNNEALKNVWKLEPDSKKDGEVVTYGLTPHVNDPDRKFMKINFYQTEMLQNGKDIINTAIQDETGQYFRNFRQVTFEKPEKEDFEKELEFWSESHRFYRRVLAYRTLLKKAGFSVSKSLKPKMTFGNNALFSAELIQSMRDVQLPKNDIKKENLIHASAEVLALKEPSWEALANAFEGLFYYFSTDAYNSFNSGYIRKSSSGESWAEPDFERILEMFVYSKGTNLLGKCIPQHSESAKSDFAQDIYEDLVKGKLVIIDQSTGAPDLNKDAADRIMKKIFTQNFIKFKDGSTPPDILVYIEEAHNLLPPDKEKDYKDIWVRTAKEGAKCRIGMVYATQEVSSIQKNILKNTANWFIAHLNNTDETKELCKYYDFADFELSIRRAQDKGFLRVKTLSNPFVIPAQIDKFDITT